jgi:phenylpropionate dioxygenase-like ring-hydroxylating dioxygenase large terminal subunit
MRDDFVTELHRRTSAAVQTGRSEAGEGSGSVPVAQYRSAARAEGEQHLLRQFPQPVVGSSALAASGAWLSLNYFGTPLLIVRQADGRAQAFLNVCRHRGARVVAEGSGTEARAFVCPYHAWTYQADGALRGVPEVYGFPCLQPEHKGLRTLATVERAGVVWVVLDPASKVVDLNGYLGPLMDNLEFLTGLKNPVAYAPRSYEVEANWKLLVDGSFEAYHFKVAHRQTIAHMFMNNLQVVDELGLHRRLYLVKAKFAEQQPQIADFDPRRFGNLIYFFFPNTSVLVQPDHAQLSCLEPLSAGRTRVHEITLIPQVPHSDKAHAHWEANVALYRSTLAEDYVLAESIQAGLASGANEALTFGTFEFSAPRFHAQLQQQMDALQAAN